MVGVQRVLTESDGKVEKNTVILGEEKGEITFVVEGRDVERVAATSRGKQCSRFFSRQADCWIKS